VDPDTMNRLDAIRRRLRRAKKGPWFFGGPVRRDARAVKEHPSMPRRYWEIGRAPIDIPPAIACAGKKADADLIANAPEDIAFLLDMVDRLAGSCR